MILTYTVPSYDGRPFYGPLPDPQSGSCRRCNPSVFTLWITRLGTSVVWREFKVSIFRRPHRRTKVSIFRRPHRRTNRDDNSNLRGEPPSSAAWTELVPTEGWLKSPGAISESEQHPSDHSKLPMTRRENGLYLAPCGKRRVFRDYPQF
jgi:hypothetical protein